LRPATMTKSLIAYSDRLDHSFREHPITDSDHSITGRSAATVWVG
jgi:hypothetical protein